MLRKKLLLLALGCLAACTSVEAQPAIAPPAEITVTRDVVYATGLVGLAGGAHERNLLMDVYTPAATPGDTSPRPAVLLAFGGSFHRGSKGEERYSEDGAQNSSMADYCRTLAREGYVCFSMEYRLTPEDPALATAIDPSRLMPEALAVTPATTGRIDFARAQMGLPPLDESGRAQLWRAILAASEDMQAAITHIQAAHETYDVDPERLAVGGFSAGAITAINAAYGAGAPVRAVVSLSGSSWGYYLPATIAAGQPPLLMLVGQNDLPSIRGGSANLAALLDQAGIAHTSAWVAGYAHFYPMGAVTLAPDFSKVSVEQRILAFLDENLKAAP